MEAINTPQAGTLIMVKPLSGRAFGFFPDVVEVSGTRINMWGQRGNLRTGHRYGPSQAFKSIGQHDRWQVQEVD